MKIAILNECFFNKGHMDRLKKLGDVVDYKNTTEEKETINRLKDADVAIVDQFLAPFNKTVLESVNKLKLLALNSTGFHNVDLETAKRRGIKVANIPGFSKQSVAELAIALMFAVNRKLAFGDRLMRQKPIEPDPGNKEDQKLIGFDLKGKTLGVVGLGKIGTATAELGGGLGMNVIAYTRTPKKVKGVKLVSKEELVRTSDVISLHVPLTTETKNLISKKDIELMKENAILINTTRPEVIDMKALYDALEQNKIYGAGLDYGGSIKPNDPILKLDNVVFTPHIGSFTKEAFFENLPNMIVENVESFVKGKPKNSVN